MNVARVPPSEGSARHASADARAVASGHSTRFFVSLIAVALSSLVIASAACGRPPAPSVESPIATRTLVDDSGCTIVLSGVPRRVVALAPSLVEIVYAVGGESQLVGVSSYSDYPPQAKSLPEAGSYVAPNIEAILALKPDLLLVVMEGPPKESILRLRELGIPTAVLRSNRITDITKNIRWIGDALGLGDSGAIVAAHLERRYLAVKATVADLPRPSVLYAIALDPVITVGRTSFINDLIRDAGGINIAGDIEAPYPRMTLETIIDRAPEIILFGADGMGNEARGSTQRAFWSRYAALPAVRLDGLRPVQRDLINRPGPRIDQALADLAVALHPERRVAVEEALRHE